MTQFPTLLSLLFTLLQGCQCVASTFVTHEVSRKNKLSSRKFVGGLKTATPWLLAAHSPLEEATSPYGVGVGSGDGVTPMPSPRGIVDRRSALSSVGVCLSLVSTPLVAPYRVRAEPMVVPNNFDIDLISENGLLESRVTENLMSAPPYGLDGTDIFYPSYFSGVWNVSSIATEVYAPCGIPMFGGNATYGAAQREIGPDRGLRYRARFLPQNEGVSTTIADREFNVRDIAKSAMGTNAVVDVSLVTPNKFSCLLAPAGAGKLFNVDMIALARRAETIDENRFHASEVVRQIISPAGQRSGIPSSAADQGPNLKEIETISLYTLPPPDATGTVSQINCVQRSATFLLPSQTDPMAYRMWQAARGRPIDVRFYDVTYTKNR